MPQTEGRPVADGDGWLTWQPCPAINRTKEVSYMFLRELWDYMRVRKRWWLLPILVALLLLGGLVALTEGTVAAPLIYTLF